MQVTDAMVDAALHGADYIPNNDNRIWMRAALTAALAEMWRPIEDAPKDRPILLAAYIVPSDEAQRNGSRPFWDVAIGRAYGTNLDRWSGILGTRATHFMPLPSPPMGK